MSGGKREVPGVIMGILCSCVSCNVHIVYMSDLKGRRINPFPRFYGNTASAEWV